MSAPSAETVRQIAIDARWMSSGAGTYAFNVLSRVKACDPSLRVHALASQAFRERVMPFCDEVTVLEAGFFSLREQLAVAAIGHRSPLHSMHYNAPLLHRGALIVTIPDVTPLLGARYCSTWKSRLYARPVLRAIAARADHILTVSEYSRQQLVHHLGVHPEKITVAYNGVGAEFRPMDKNAACELVRQELGIGPPFLLYVGNFRLHKNVDALLRAFQLLRGGAQNGHRLLLLGEDGTMLPQLRERARVLGISGATLFRQHVPQALLIACYCAADLLVQPSFEEGFGLPVLEAMACGTPVASSRAAALPEVGGDAVTYFDPHQDEEIAEAIMQSVEGTERREQMRRRGLARAAEFTWEKSAQIHVDIYRRYVN